jgi:ketosteroid isomerase-like protein
MIEERTRIEQLEAEEVAAFLNADVARLRELWSPDVVVNAPHNRLMPDREATLAAIESGRLRHAEITRTVEIVRILGDVAVSMGSETIRDDEGPMAGPPHRRRYTNVWQRDGDQWRVIARHAHVHR